MELDAFTAFLAGLALLSAVLFARALYKVRKEHRHLHKKIQDKTASLEFQAQSLKSDFRELQESNNSKVDLEYMNKRIDALINLLHGK
ncbi:MAG: hypothetical protein QXR53_04005 [Candidatus Norongarragalinales archaeon]